MATEDRYKRASKYPDALVDEVCRRWFMGQGAHQISKEINADGRFGVVLSREMAYPTLAVARDRGLVALFRT